MTEPDDRRIDEAGRRRIAKFVDAALGWAGMESAKRLAGTGRVSKATIDRVKRGEDVSDTMLRGLGVVLELPRDYLLYIGYGDVDRIKELADTDDLNRQDLIHWTLIHLFPENPNPTTGANRTA